MKIVATDKQAFPVNYSKIQKQNLYIAVFFSNIHLNLYSFHKKCYDTTPSTWLE